MKVELLRKDFARALGQLQSALQVPATSDLLKAGCIQYFEFCFELAWKTIFEAMEALGERISTIP